VDWAVLLFALAVIGGVLFGLAPALDRRADLVTALKETTVPAAAADGSGCSGW
jgi:hypothetical protein